MDTNNNLSLNTIRFLEKSEEYRHWLEEITVPRKTVLLREGETSQQLFFVKQGALRLGVNNKGEDITFRFCFENEAVSSFFGNEPSLFSIETIEPSTIIVLKIDDMKKLLNLKPEYKDAFIDQLIKRLNAYAKLFLLHITKSPEERYIDLMKNNPEVLLRVPQHYIATYLGITPVSLSRIRNRVAKIQ